MVEIIINGNKVIAQEGMSIMEAAQLANIHIPNLCFLKDIHKYGTCRICSVEVEGMKTLQPSCVLTVKEGMQVFTNTKKVREARKVLYELMLADHPKDCLACSRNQSCELQRLGSELGVGQTRIQGTRKSVKIDYSTAITRDLNKCILCRRCETICNELQQVGAIAAQNRGFETTISPSLNLLLDQTACAMCGQCTLVCPTGALTETDGLTPVWNALEDPAKRVIVQVAPAVRAALGEEFDLETGSIVTKKMAQALHEIGFDDVFDTLFAADLTIIEEGTELLQRLTDAIRDKKKSTLPMITSCSPGWIKHVEHQFNDQLEHLSTCKSPHTMMGAVIKSYYAKKLQMDPKDLYVVSVMPCTAKKFEIARPEMQVDQIRDVDAVLTTRELAKMIRSSGIDFNQLSEGEFDRPLGLSTGAADIFGVTGGVMEAALRTVFEMVTGKELPFKDLHVTPVVGLTQIKTAQITIVDPLPEYAFLTDVTLSLAVTSGLEGASILMKEIKEKKSPYHFIEVMGCPGGCINGGGQPRNREEGYREKRINALYGEDEAKTLRKSHENPDIITLYKEFLGEPNGHLSHQLLHTHYVPRHKQLTQF